MGHRRWRLLGVGLVLVIVQAASCPAALAGTAAVERRVDCIGDPHGGCGEFVTYTIAYRAARGEPNDVTITALDNRSAAIHDDGAPVVAGRDCQQEGMHDARCSVPDLFYDVLEARAFLGDGNDKARLLVAPGDPSAAAVGLGAEGGTGGDILLGSKSGSGLEGGPGNDLLEADARSRSNALYGGAGDDTLVGGPGDDYMYGGAGSDKLFGGAGNDTMQGDSVGARPARDVLDGGPGDDSVLYTDHSKPVNVDLSRSDGNGQRGENDHVVRVENVWGGAGSDRLVGDGQANYIQGSDPEGTGAAKAVRGAHDVLIGRGGEDDLEGEAARDVLLGGAGGDVLDGGGGGTRYRGGPGDDDISVVDTGAPAQISCGPGGDRLHFARPRDVFPANCEEVQLSANADFDVFTRITRSSADSVAMHLIVFSNEEGYCRAAIRLFVLHGTQRRLLGEGAVRIHQIDRKERVSIALSGLGQTLLIPGRTLPVEVEGEGLRNCRAHWNELGSPYPDFTVLAHIHG